MLLERREAIHVDGALVPRRIFWIGIDVQRTEHAEHLADIPRQSTGAGIDDSAVPLDAIMLRRIPDEGIADRRICRPGVLGHIQTGGGDLVQDGADRIEAGMPIGGSIPWLRSFHA